MLGTLLVSVGVCLQGISIYTHVEALIYLAAAVAGAGYGSVYICTLQHFVLWLDDFCATQTSDIQNVYSTVRIQIR